MWVLGGGCVLTPALAQEKLPERADGTPSVPHGSKAKGSVSLDLSGSKALAKNAHSSFFSWWNSSPCVEELSLDGQTSGARIPMMTLLSPSSGLTDAAEASGRGAADREAPGRT